MSHEIREKDVVVLKGQKAWHGLGTVIDENLGAYEAYKRFWEVNPVERWPLAAISPSHVKLLMEGVRMLEFSGDPVRALLKLQEYQDAMLSVTTHVANVRPDVAGDELMGVVGSAYQICSDADLALFTDTLSDTGKVTVETCGTLKNGKLVWFLARGEEFEIGNGDTVFPYMCVSNAHDGTNALRVTPTTVRVVCANTLGMCIGTVGSEIGNSAIAIRHSGDISQKLVEAKRAMRQYEKGLEDTKIRFQQLRSTPVTRKQAVELFADQYAANWEVADNQDLRSNDSAVRKLAERRMYRMESASKDFMTRFEAEANKFGGANMWLAMNAFTGYMQHDRKAPGKDDDARAENKIESNLFSNNARRSFETLQKAIELAA